MTSGHNGRRRVTDAGHDANPGNAAPLDLDDAVEWLVSAEAGAGALYAKAARLFASNRDLSALLEELSVDESAHLDMLVSAGRQISGLARPLPVDLTVIDGISPIIRMFEEEVEAGTISEAGLMEMVVALEFSEHNELFAYVVNALRNFPGEFTDLVESLKKHRDRITGHLRSKPGLKGLLERVESFPELDGRSVLVVDDEKTVLSLLRIIIQGNARVDAAENGEAALEVLGTEDYSLVVSDIRMPVMDGMELYRRALAMRPGLERRFLFLTGSPDEGVRDFFTANRVEFMLKPMSIYGLREKVSEMLGAIGT